MHDSPSELLKNLECDANKIIKDRTMLCNSKAALITFEGSKLPGKVYHHNCVKHVASFTPRVVVCSKFHAIGHKANTGPDSDARFDRCERLHDGMIQCQDATPQCRHGGGPHLSAAPKCPRRLQVNNFLCSTITRTPPLMFRSYRHLPTQRNPQSCRHYELSRSTADLSSNISPSNNA